LNILSLFVSCYLCSLAIWFSGYPWQTDWLEYISLTNIFYFPIFQLIIAHTWERKKRWFNCLHQNISE
jgi:hypothetical protein